MSSAFRRRSSAVVSTSCLCSLMPAQMREIPAAHVSACSSGTVPSMENGFRQH